MFKRKKKVMTARQKNIEIIHNSELNVVVQ